MLQHVSDHRGSIIREPCTVKKVKWSRYRPGLPQRVGRGIALLFHDRGTRRGWVVSSTPRPHFTPGKVSVPILQEDGWVPGPIWKGGKSRPHQNSIPDRPALYGAWLKITRMVLSCRLTCTRSVLWQHIILILSTYYIWCISWIIKCIIIIDARCKHDEVLIKFKFFWELIPCWPVNSFRRILTASMSSAKQSYYSDWPLTYVGSGAALLCHTASYMRVHYIGSVSRRVWRTARKTTRFLMSLMFVWPCVIDTII